MTVVTDLTPDAATAAASGATAEKPAGRPPR